MICFHCNKEIESPRDRVMLGLDVPYLNFWFHKDCYNNFVAPDINVYIGKNKEKVYNMVEELNKKGKNR